MRWIDFYNTVKSKTDGIRWIHAKSGTELGNCEFAVRWGTNDINAKIGYVDHEWCGSFCGKNTREYHESIDSLLEELRDLAEDHMADLRSDALWAENMACRADVVPTEIGNPVTLSEFVEIVQSVFDDWTNISSDQNGLRHVATFGRVRIGVEPEFIIQRERIAIWRCHIREHFTKGNLKFALECMSDVIPRIEKEIRMSEILLKSLNKPEGSISILDAEFLSLVVK